MTKFYSNAMQHEHVDEIRKQRDTLLSRTHILEQAQTQQQEEIARLQALNAASTVEQQATQLRHEKAAETFARTIETMMARTLVSPDEANSGAASLSRKRSRPLASEDDNAAEAVERERQSGIDRYVEGVLELRDATHARAVEELKKAHKAETDKLRAKAREPVNEFRESKRFHIREAELKAEVEKVRGALEAERARAKSMEFAQVDRMDEKREIRDLKQRCADRDHLVREIALLNEEKDRRNEPDLAKRHHAQILRAKRMYNLSRERALQLASRIDAEQLRARAAALFEEELLYAYRSLRAEYNRDVGRVPETKRPKRPRAVGVDEYGDGDWMDGVSEGEPGM